MRARGRQPWYPFCMVTVGPVIRSVSGPPTPVAFVLVFVHAWPPRRWGGGCSTRSSQTPWKNPGLFSGQHGHFGWAALAGAGGLQPPACLLRGSLGVSPAGVRVVILEPQPSEPLSTCAFTPSACKGSDLPLKMITSTFFFCILINTEEAGAVKLYLGGKPPELVYLVLRGTSYCFQYTISNQLFCILVFSFHFDKQAL